MLHAETPSQYPVQASSPNPQSLAIKMSIQENNILTISYMNIHGQSKLPTVKQLQIQDFIKYNKNDILQMQEIEIDDETFTECEYLSSNFHQ